jgi:hypothetical protein
LAKEIEVKNPLFSLPKKNTQENTNTAPSNDNSNDTKNTPTIANSNTISNSNNPSTINNTNYSTNTNTVIAEKKTKYVDSKVQRAYWIDKKILKIFEKEFPKDDYDRSQIVTNLIRKFLQDNGKL